jgi:hypothetical protein
MRKAQPVGSFREVCAAARQRGAEVPLINPHDRQDWPKFDQRLPKLSAAISA